jgi:hypothetical protein
MGNFRGKGLINGPRSAAAPVWAGSPGGCMPVDTTDPLGRFSTDRRHRRSAFVPGARRWLWDHQSRDETPPFPLIGSPITVCAF